MAAVVPLLTGFAIDMVNGLAQELDYFKNIRSVGWVELPAFFNDFNQSTFPVASLAVSFVNVGRVATNQQFLKIRTENMKGGLDQSAPNHGKKASFCYLDESIVFILVEWPETGQQGIEIVAQTKNVYLLIQVSSIKLLW